MAVTVLSGTSGALYYKPAGTNGNFPESGVNASTDVITVQPYLNFKAGDPVKFRVINSQTGGSGSGTTTSLRRSRNWRVGTTRSAIPCG